MFVIELFSCSLVKRTQGVKWQGLLNNSATKILQVIPSNTSNSPAWVNGPSISGPEESCQQLWKHSMGIFIPMWQVKFQEGFELKIGCVMNRKEESRGFPGGAVVKNPPANAGDMGSSPGPGRSHMPRSN